MPSRCQPARGVRPEHERTGTQPSQLCRRIGRPGGAPDITVSARGRARRGFCVLRRPVHVFAVASDRRRGVLGTICLLIGSPKYFRLVAGWWNSTGIVEPGRCARPADRLCLNRRRRVHHGSQRHHGDKRPGCLAAWARGMRDLSSRCGGSIDQGGISSGPQARWSGPVDCTSPLSAALTDGSPAISAPNRRSF